jgi:co-chaperonin GroES (HSP10)
MSRRLVVLIMCTVALPLVCQTSSPKYQPGTITAVSAHASQGHDRDATQYDVSLKVGDTLYVVLYTAHSGSVDPKFVEGTNKLVLVGRDTITFNDALGKTAVVPILRRETLPAHPTLDWSQAPSKYFSMKLQYLSEKLDLSESQKDKIKPILEQEAGEAGEVVANPVLSSEDKLNRIEKIVRSSDKELKTFLSAEQWQTLQSIRKDQKQELKQLMAAKKSNTIQ